MRPRNLEKEQAIRAVALRIIADEGLENLSMQKLAKEAGISPRTLYIKYADKEDLLIRLFIDEVLGAYEKAVLENFDATMPFDEGVKKLWSNAFHFLINHRPSFALLQYGKSSPLLNKAFQANNIRQGEFFSPIHHFLNTHIQAGIIPSLHMDIYRALLFSPLIDLVSEYFDYTTRPEQIITEEVIMQCCQTVIAGLTQSK